MSHALPATITTRAGIGIASIMVAALSNELTQFATGAIPKLNTITEGNQTEGQNDRFSKERKNRMGTKWAQSILPRDIKKPATRK